MLIVHLGPGVLNMTRPDGRLDYSLKEDSGEMSIKMPHNRSNINNNINNNSKNGNNKKVDSAAFGHFWGGQSQVRLCDIQS